MKAFGVALFAFFIMVKAYALPVGNPWDAYLLRQGLWCGGYHGFSFRVGFYGDYVFNRHMVLDTSQHQGISRFKIFTNAGYLALNFRNRIDFFATLGTTEMQFETRTQTLGLIVPHINVPLYFETDTHFSWSLGLRGTLWQWRCLAIGVEGQYFRARPHLNFFREESFPPVYLSNDSFKYHEWQAGIGASYRVNISDCRTALVPYIAVKWSQSRTHADQPNLFFQGPFTLFDLENGRNTGFAVGLSLVGCEWASVTVEGRFVDEKAVHVNSQFRF